MNYRIIPVLLIDTEGMWKTRRFRRPTYLGDVVNAVKIFSDKECDEIVVLDYLATVQDREPQFELVRQLAAECFMPLCYGGGVRSVRHCERLFACGVEKVALNSAAIANPSLFREASREFGSQSVVASVDYRRRWFGKQVVVARHGQITTQWSVENWVRRVESEGAGEILLQCVDRDGCGSGYDMATISKAAHSVQIPVIACGGAATIEDLKQVILEGGAAAAAGGSIFVFHGAQKGVLLSYPKLSN